MYNIYTALVQYISTTEIFQKHSGFWKTRNDGIFRGTFRGTFFKNLRNGSKWSKYTYV